VPFNLVNNSNPIQTERFQTSLVFVISSCSNIASCITCQEPPAAVAPYGDPLDALSYIELNRANRIVAGAKDRFSRPSVGCERLHPRYKCPNASGSRSERVFSSRSMEIITGQKKLAPLEESCEPETSEIRYAFPFPGK